MFTVQPHTLNSPENWFVFDCVSLENKCTTIIFINNDQRRFLSKCSLHMPLTVQQSDSHVSDVVRFTCFYALIALTKTCQCKELM